MTPMTTREIAKILGICHGTVQNIEKSALRKVRIALGLELPGAPSRDRRRMTRERPARRS